MNVTIPPDLLCFLIPAILIFIQTRFISSERTGGGGIFPALSDRDFYWVIGIPIWLIVSFASWAIYLKVKG